MTSVHRTSHSLRHTISNNLYQTQSQNLLVAHSSSNTISPSRLSILAAITNEIPYLRIPQVSLFLAWTGEAEFEPNTELVVLQHGASGRLIQQPLEEVQVRVHLFAAWALILTAGQ